MPSPFPGMDPYLESREYFPDLHDALVYCLREQLNAVLPQPYFAKGSQHVWLEHTERYVEPDVSVIRPVGQELNAVRGGTALAVNEPLVITVEQAPGDEHTEARLEICAWQGSDKRLVTAIEVLSWSNKTRGTPGRELYLKKQREVLTSDANLLEIDLLRKGEHVTAVPLEVARQRFGPFDYHVSTHRFDRPQDYFLHPLRLGDNLPTVAVPLLPDDGSVALDLQAAFTKAYDSGSFSREVRYLEQPPDIALTSEQAAWARGILSKALGDVQW
jgi:hypothetical protein